MWHLQQVLSYHFDNVLMTLLWCLIFLAVSFQRGWKQIDAFASELDTRLDTLMERRPLEQRSFLIAASLPVTTILFSAICYTQGTWVICGAALVLLFVALVLFLLACLCWKRIWIVLFLSDIRESISQTFMGALCIGAMVFFYRRSSYLPSPSWCIPLFCRLMCLWCLYALYQLRRADRSEAHYAVPALARLVVMCTHVLQIVVLWGLSGYYSALYTAQMPLTMGSWLRGSLLYSDVLYAIAVRISGLAHLILLSIPVIGITKRALQKTPGRVRQLKLFLPAALTAAVLAGMWVEITGIPTLGQGIGSPIIPQEACTTYLRDAKEGTIPVLQNGAYLQLDAPVFIDGESFAVNLTVLDDFSDRPYLRYYAKLSGDGTFSVWVENQGGAPAEDCTFRLSGQERTLSSYYPKELLRTSVDILEPGARQQLFTLAPQGLLRTEYGLIPLTLEIRSAFTSGGKRQKALRELPEEIYLTMNGLTIEAGCDLWPYGMELERDHPLMWTQSLGSSDSILNDFQCSQTVLAEMQIIVLHQTGENTHLEPFRFICEHP